MFLISHRGNLNGVENDQEKSNGKPNPIGSAFGIGKRLKKCLDDAIKIHGVLVVVPLYFNGNFHVQNHTEITF